MKLVIRILSVLLRLFIEVMLKYCSGKFRDKYFSVALKAEYRESNTLELASRVIKLFYSHYGKKEIVDMVKMFRFKEKLKFKVDLIDEEYEKIYNAVDDLRVKLALELIAGSELRPAEALGIIWE